MMHLHPAHGFGTVLMTNATGFNVRRLLDRLDAVVKHALPAG